MYFLGKHPEIQKKLQTEVDSILEGRSPSYEDISHLKYCKQTLEETLRLRPALSGLGKYAVEDSKN
jgi:cytochrome P450